jgi:hypothetical protein
MFPASSPAEAIVGSVAGGLEVLVRAFAALGPARIGPSKPWSTSRRMADGGVGPSAGLRAGRGREAGGGIFARQPTGGEPRSRTAFASNDRSQIGTKGRGPPSRVARNTAAKTWPSSLSALGRKLTAALREGRTRSMTTFEELGSEAQRAEGRCPSPPTEVAGHRFCVRIEASQVCRAASSRSLRLIAEGLSKRGDRGAPVPERALTAKRHVGQTSTPKLKAAVHADRRRPPTEPRASVSNGPGKIAFWSLSPEWPVRRWWESKAPSRSFHV